MVPSKAQVVAGLDTHPDTTFTIARIERDREAAAGRFVRDRDTHALEQAMSRLDAEEASARTSTQGNSARAIRCGAVTSKRGSE